MIGQQFPKQRHSPFIEKECVSSAGLQYCGTASGLESAAGRTDALDATTAMVAIGQNLGGKFNLGSSALHLPAPFPEELAE